MTDSEGVIPHEAEFLLYQTEDGRARAEVRFDGETAWLTQAGLAELFQTRRQNITQHIAAIYAERELEEARTCKPYLQVGPGIFTRMPFLTATVKVLGTVNTGTGRRPRRDDQVASSIPVATEGRTRWPTRAEDATVRFASAPRWWRRTAGGAT